MILSQTAAGFETLTDSDALVDGVRLAYTDHGDGEPVVLIHGTPSHSYLWRNIAPRVRDAGYRTVVYDLLGFGRSERPIGRDTSVTAQADVLVGLLDQLLIDSAHIVAHDIGGAIGQILAVRYPERVRRLMLIDTVTYDSWPSDTWRKIIRDNDDSRYVHQADDFSAMLSRQLRMTVTNPNSMNDEILRNYLSPHDGAAGRASFFTHQVSHYDSRHTEQIADQLPSLTLPVRVVWGADDRWQPVSYAERLCGDIPGAELSILANAGHFLPEDAPDALTAEILAFLPNAT
jgi:pimeloyl-ACP methyl ester carboxylesterase